MAFLSRSKKSGSTEAAAAGAAATTNGENESLLASGLPTRAALDSVPANIFLATPAYDIVYANAYAERSLGRAERGLKEAFPTHLAELLASNCNSLPYQASFTFGGTSVELTINSVLDAGRRLVAYTVASVDVTEQRRAQEETDMLSRHLGENATITAAQASAAAAASEEMSASIREISHATAKAASVAHQAVEAAESARPASRSSRARAPRSAAW